MKLSDLFKPWSAEKQAELEKSTREMHATFRRIASRLRSKRYD